VVGPEPDQVALVGNDVVDFELAEKTARCRVFLVAFLAGLDRNRDMAAVGEAPTGNRVGDMLGAPEIQEQVGADQLFDVELARFPVFVEIVFRAVGKIAYVGNGDLAAVDGRSGQPSDLGPPVAVVVRPRTATSD
jgi:hypothetical protein